jgi:uncharacterized protein YeaO (DUF488 family)
VLAPVEKSAGRFFHGSGRWPAFPGRLAYNESVMTRLNLKRVYEAPSPRDGLRVLVERLWPRGLSRERAAVDLWLKDVAPSPELRKWFGHDPARWQEFRTRYWAELRDKKDAIKLLKQKRKEGAVTLVYAARDEEHNGALALRQFLEGRRR